MEGVLVEKIKLREALKHGNLISNLIKADREDIVKQNYETDEISENICDNPETESSSEDELLICYEPSEEDRAKCFTEEELLMKEAFDLLNNFVNNFPNFMDEIIEAHKEIQRPKIYKSYLRKCRICQKAYTNQKDLDEHKQLHFEMDRSFSCKICRKLFFDVRNLKNHEKNHARESCKCSICLKEFRLKKYLDQHMVQHHEATHKGFNSYGNTECETDDETAKEVDFPCDHCGKVFQSKSKHKTHVKKHFVYKQFKCKKCSKAFSKLAKLQAHMINHKINPDSRIRSSLLRCSYCGKLFRNQTNLSEHTAIHEGLKNKK